MTDLATRIETEPPTRELEEQALAALGMPPQYWEFATPLHDETDAFVLVGDRGIVVSRFNGKVCAILPDDGGKGDAPTIPRAVTAALIRATEATHD